MAHSASGNIVLWFGFMIWFNRIVGIFLIVLLLLLLGLWAFSPALSRLIINQALEPQAVSLSPQSRIRFNPFSSRLTVDQFALLKEEQQTLSIDTLELQYRFAALFKKQLALPLLSVTGLHINAEKNGDQLTLAGLDILAPDNGSKPKEDDVADSEARAEFSVIVERVEFNDISFTLREETQTRNAEFAQLLITDTHYQQSAQGQTLNSTMSLKKLHYSDQHVAAKLGHYTLEVEEAQVNERNRLSLRVSSSLSAAALFQSDTDEALASIEGLGINDLSLRYVPQQSDAIHPQPSGPPNTQPHPSPSTLAITLTLPSLAAKKLALTLPAQAIQLEVAALQFKDTHYAHTDKASAKTTLTIDDLAYADTQQSASLKQASITLQELQHPTHDTRFEQAEAKLSVTLDGFSAQRNSTGDTIAAFSAFDVPHAHIQRDGNALSYRISALSIADLLASEKNSEHQAPLLALGELAFNDLTGSEKHIDIQSILIGKLSSYSHLTESGLSNLILPVPQTSTADKQENTASITDKPPLENEETTFTFAIDELRTTDKAQFDLLDETKKRPLKKTLTLNELMVSNINSRDKDESMRFSASLQDENYMHFSIDGQAQPFKEQVNAQIESELKEFSLPQVNKYLADTLGFEFKTGELDTNISGQIIDSEMDMKVVLTLRGSDFSASQTPEDEINLIGQSAVPLNVALSLLKDKRGNIKLNVPISGNIHDPDFGFQYLLALVAKKAVMRQTKNYLMTTFVPYAQVVNVAIAAGSYALKVRFEDLEYLPGQVALSDKQHRFVDQLAALMQDKPKLNIKVCPVTSTADASAATHHLNTIANADSESQALLSIAEKRASVFKGAVVAKGVDSSRLLLCRAKLESAETQNPRLRFSI